MKKFGMLAIIVLTAVMASCTASMPQEAVQLSSSLGQMISRANIAHVNMVNKYFDGIAVQVDQFALGTYKQTLLTNVRKKAKEVDPKFTDLTTDQYDKMMTRIMAQRLEWLHAVEVNRQQILRELDDYYTLMDKVNIEVTNIIRSAAGVDSAKNQLVKDITAQFGKRAKEIEDKLLGANSNIENMLNDAVKKVIGE